MVESIITAFMPRPTNSYRMAVIPMLRQPNASTETHTLDGGTSKSVGTMANRSTKITISLPYFPPKTTPGQVQSGDLY